MDDPSEMMKDEVKKALELTEDQQAKIKAMVDGIKSKAEEKIPGIKATLEELLDIVHAKKFGWRLKAKKHKDELDKFKEAKAQFEEKAAEEFSAILTVPQKTKLALLMRAKFAEKKEAGEAGPAGKLVVLLKDNAEDLEFTDKQKEGMKGVMEEGKKTAADMVEKAKPLFTKLEEAKDDEKACETALVEIRALVKTARAAKEAIMEKLKKVLDPEQMVRIALLQMEQKKS